MFVSAFSSPPFCSPTSTTSPWRMELADTSAALEDGAAQRQAGHVQGGQGALHLPQGCWFCFFCWMMLDVGLFCTTLVVLLLMFFGYHLDFFFCRDSFLDFLLISTKGFGSIVCFGHQTYPKMLVFFGIQPWV